MRISRNPSKSLHSTIRSSPCPRCLFYPHLRPQQSCQDFHTSVERPAKHRSPYRSITQAELQRIADARASLFPNYSPHEREQLRKTYSRDQQAAIDLGEKAVSPYDLSRGKLRRDVLRPKYVDPHGFSRFQPVIDTRPTTSAGEWDRTDDDQPTKTLNYLPNVEKRMSAITNAMVDPAAEEDMSLTEDDYGGGESNKSPSERRNLIADYWYGIQHPSSEAGVLKGNERSEMEKAIDGDEEAAAAMGAKSTWDEEGDRVQTFETEALVDRLERTLPKALKDRPRIHPLTAAQRLENALHWRDPFHPPEVSQEIPKIEDPRWEYENSADAAEDEADEASTKKGAAGDESSGAWQRLANSLGQSVDKIQKYRMKNLLVKRVVNQTRLGKIESQYCLVVVGDERGIVGLGEGKAQDVDVAQRMAHLSAVRNMKPIRRYEKRTIFGEVQGKVGASVLKMNARPPGFGLRVSQTIYEIAKCAGLEDLQAKSLRSRNRMNVAKAMVEALYSQKDPEDVARSRGKKMVDVRKVYYAGLV